jgi:hypothetical protein
MCYFGIGRIGRVALVAEEAPTSVPVTEEPTHFVADVEVFDVSGKAFPRDSAFVESEFDLFRRAVVHPVEEKVKGGRVGEREVDNGVGVRGGKEVGSSSVEGIFRVRDDSRPAKETSQETRLRAEIIDVGLTITFRPMTIEKEQKGITDLE